MGYRNPLLSALIFPVAPIVVIYLIHRLCLDIWMASFYTPGEDGGEVEPAVAMIIIPMLLVFLSGVLAGLTALNRWRQRRQAPGPLWKGLLGMARILLALLSLLLFLVSAMFFMGDTLGVFRHWQVAGAWLMFGVVAGAFGVQQYARLRE